MTAASTAPDRTRNVLDALRVADDEVNGLPNELAAIAELMRLAAQHPEGLGAIECRGVFELLDFMQGQAVRARMAYDAAFDAAKSAA